jgi:hypothetical protein
MINVKNGALLRGLTRGRPPRTKPEKIANSILKE